MARHRDDSIDESPPSGGVWALPLLALGLGLVACCYLIPAADETRAIVSERQRLRLELEGLERQAALNADFLERLHTEHDLALRLATRQRTEHEPGVAILSPAPAAGGGGLGNFAMSPFALLATEPPAPPTASVPAVGGRLADLCRDSRARLIVLGGALFACVVGLLSGAGNPGHLQRPFAHQLRS